MSHCNLLVFHKIVHTKLFLAITLCFFGGVLFCFVLIFVVVAAVVVEFHCKEESSKSH